MTWTASVPAIVRVCFQGFQQSLRLDLKFRADFVRRFLCPRGQSFQYRFLTCTFFAPLRGNAGGFTLGGLAASTFTQSDIANGQVAFTHDGGEIAPGLSADMIRVRVIDGRPHVLAVWRAGVRVS